MSAIQEFINRYNGQNGVGDTPQNDGQCVGLVEAWFDYIGSPHVWGNACDLPANADRNAYTVTPNTPDYVPEPGEVGCYPAGWEGSSVGHTFVVAPGTTASTLVAFEQNDRLGGGDGRCRLYDLPWSPGLTFIRPHVLDVSAPSAPVADPAPVAVPTPPAPVPAPEPAPAPVVEPVVVPVVPSEPPVNASPVVIPTPAPAPVIVPVKGDPMKVTPKWHQVLAGFAVALPVVENVFHAISGMQTVSVVALVAAIVAALEKL